MVVAANRAAALTFPSGEDEPATDVRMNAQNEALADRGKHAMPVMARSRLLPELSMRPRDLLLFSAVCLIWALNLIVSRVLFSMFDVPPIFYAAARS